MLGNFIVSGGWTSCLHFCDVRSELLYRNFGAEAFQVLLIIPLSTQVCEHGAVRSYSYSAY